ncbi:hypothetical protein [Propylenella binzhouense]|uniref:Lipoprotein n=1 Tax=Propylenella binzhouense TaxID=2555902 RepID=A0A964T163_9HYPH|nr:hypothetical protein [Propylenella binzhouense]MYZ46523.1 hypothetical protein [Propylenella binzhouense]
MNVSSSAAKLLPAICLLSAALAAAGCSSTTYGTGEAPEMAIFNEFTGSFIGGGRSKPNIDYKPRAPLVVPPQAELRTPAEPATVSTPNWPDDPDQKVVQRDYSDPSFERARYISQAEYERTRPIAEINRSRKSLEESQAEARDGAAPARDFAVSSRQESKEFKAALNAAEGRGDTGRRYLTDPPEEYRQPSGSAPQTFEDIKEDKPGNFFTRLFN